MKNSINEALGTGFDLEHAEQWQVGMIIRDIFGERDVKEFKRMLTYDAMRFLMDETGKNRNVAVHGSILYLLLLDGLNCLPGDGTLSAFNDNEVGFAFFKLTCLTAKQIIEHSDEAIKCYLAYKGSERESELLARAIDTLYKIQRVAIEILALEPMAA